jgi:MraZ protein
MLLGQYSGTTGAKRRLSVPKKFVKELGQKMVIAKWYEGCLVLVSLERWEELLNRLTGGARSITESIRQVDRFVSGSAFEVEVDQQGRILIPELLYDFAGLEREVTFLGLMDRVEIWSKRVWDERQKKIELEARQALEKLADEKKNPRASNDS